MYLTVRAATPVIGSWWWSLPLPQKLAQELYAVSGEFVRLNKRFNMRSMSVSFNFYSAPWYFEQSVAVQQLVHKYPLAVTPTGDGLVMGDVGWLPGRPLAPGRPKLRQAAITFINVASHYHFGFLLTHDVNFANSDTFFLPLRLLAEIAAGTIAPVAEIRPQTQED